MPAQRALMISAGKRGSMYATKRKAFAMIMAIFVILMIAIGGAMIMRNASIGSDTLKDNYLRAQAELLAQSATEYAVMRMQGFNNAGGGCLNHLYITVKDATGTDDVYDINVSMLYAFEGANPGGTCVEIAHGTGQPTRALIDTTVSTHPGNNISTEPITIHHRSWQTF